MAGERISVIDAARAVGRKKQSVFKVLKRLGIETLKERSAQNKGQAIAYISLHDFQRLKTEIASRQRTLVGSADADLGGGLGFDYGFFYLIQLEPQHDPERFKVGFAISVDERLRAHKCSAPFAQVVNAWPCKRLWEKTAIDCVSSGCEQLHTEVFRADDLTTVIAKCDEFFAVMPSFAELESNTGDEGRE